MARYVSQASCDSIHISLRCFEFSNIHIKRVWEMVTNYLTLKIKQTYTVPTKPIIEFIVLLAVTPAIDVPCMVKSGFSSQFTHLKFSQESVRYESYER